MAIHDPKEVLLDVRDGIERLLRSRLCASTPAQLGYLAGLEVTVHGWTNIQAKFNLVVNCAWIGLQISMVWRSKPQEGPSTCSLA